MFIPQGHRLVKSGTFTQANARLSLVDGTAFFDCGADLSAYAGLDTGSHEYLIKVYDDDGYSIQGYVGAVGGGEGYGSEKIVGGTMETFTGGLADGWERLGGGYAGTYSQEGTIIHGGASSQKINLSSEKWAFQSSIGISDIGQGALILQSIWFYADGVYSVQSSYDSIPSSLITINTILNTWVNLSEYKTVTKITNRKIQVFDTDVITGNVYIDDISSKIVTDCASTGFHIISAQGGSTQNWQNVGASFNYNDGAYDYKIYKVR